MQKKELSRAESEYAQVCRLAPWNVSAWFNLGVIAQQGQQPEIAEYRFRMALSHPCTPEMLRRIYAALAIVIQKNPQRKTEALRWAQKAVQDNTSPDPEIIRLIEQLKSANP